MDATTDNDSRAPFGPFGPASAVSVGDLPTSTRMHATIRTQMVAKGLSIKAVGPLEGPLGYFLTLSGQDASQTPAVLLIEEQNRAVRSTSRGRPPPAGATQ